MWVFVRDHLHQRLRRDKVALAPFSVAQMPQHVRHSEEATLVLYRSTYSFRNNVNRQNFENQSD
jgi:hypothetical protein